MNHHEPIIVVVDPDADRATTLSSQLDRLGCHVFRRSSGVDALACVVECRPDLVLSESDLLDFECPELLRSIREASPSTRVIFVERRGGSPPLLEDMEDGFMHQEAQRGKDAILLAVDGLLGR